MRLDNEVQTAQILRAKYIDALMDSPSMLKDERAGATSTMEPQSTFHSYILFVELV